MLSFKKTSVDSPDAQILLQDVSFTYEITADKYDSYTIDDLDIYAYAVNDFTTTYNVTNNTISGTIQHNTASTQIRIYYRWLDDGTDTMNNQTDTTAAVSGTANADILVTFHLTQIQSSS